MLTVEGEIFKIRAVDNPVIALLTDFGDGDFFAASLRGVIAGINPSARTVDMTHRVPSFAVGAAGFILYAACPYFPQQTIFLVVVDPGVGTDRRILLVETSRFFFIAPDNGVLSMALENEKIIQVREINNAEYFLPSRGLTFEGRDKMAPAAAWLSKGIPCEKFGPEVVSYKRERLLNPRIEGKKIKGAVLYVDKFGNIITDIPVRMLAGLVSRLEGRSFTMRFLRRNAGGTGSGRGFRVDFRETYRKAAKGDFLLLEGSLGLLELAVREDSAAGRIGLKAGDRVILTCSPAKPHE